MAICAAVMGTNLLTGGLVWVRGWGWGWGGMVIAGKVGAGLRRAGLFVPTP